MLRFAFAFLILAALAALASWIAGMPGAVSIDIADYRVTTAPLTAAVAVLLFGVVFAALFRTIGWLRGGPRRFTAMRAENRRERGLKALTQGLAAIAAGDAPAAQKHARRASSLLDQPALTALLSAQAAQLAGDDAAARTHYQAMLGQPETEFLGVRGLLVQAERDGDTERALTLARRAFATAPDSPFAAKALFALEAKTGHWSAAADVLATRASAAAYEPAMAARLAAIVAFERAAEAEAKGLTEAAYDLAKQAHRTAPSFTPAAVLYARLAVAHDRPRAARAALREAWRRKPHPHLLAALRAMPPVDDPRVYRKRVEALIADNREHLESRLAAAEAALAAGAPAEARARLSPPGDPKTADARVRAAMAAIEEAAGDTAAAASWRASVDGEPESSADGYTCSACGAHHTDFRTFCSSCGALATLDAFAAGDEDGARGRWWAGLLPTRATAPTPPAVR